MATAPTENATNKSNGILQRETHKDLTHLIYTTSLLPLKFNGGG